MIKRREDPINLYIYYYFNFLDIFYFNNIKYFVGVMLKFNKLLIIEIINLWFIDPLITIIRLSYFRDNSVIFLESSYR